MLSTSPSRVKAWVTLFLIAQVLCSLAAWPALGVVAWNLTWGSLSTSTCPDGIKISMPSEMILKCQKEQLESYGWIIPVARGALIGSPLCLAGGMLAWLISRLQKTPCKSCGWIAVFQIVLFLAFGVVFVLFSNRYDYFDSFKFALYGIWPR